MGKVLTISIAAYNVERFLRKTLDSLLIDNMELLEVIIVNDGSKDNTLEIAQEYVKKYPKTFKVIDKANGGYGSTINASIKKATGKYYKQLDGDDWYNTKNLNKLVDMLQNVDSDIVYTQYETYYEKDESSVVNKNVIEKYKNKTVEIDEIIKDADILFMHSLAYKTELLKKNNIKIEEKCFYTDTQYILLPLLKAKTIHIFGFPVYVYRFGLNEQSVGIIGRKKHWLDHKKISYKLMDLYKNNCEQLTDNKRAYYEKHLTNIFTSGIANYLFTQKPTKEQFNIMKQYDLDVKNTSEKIYEEMAKKSKGVQVVRNNNYVMYVIVYLLKNILWKLGK